MDPDKTFLLKWNDFQQNISSTIRNLRMDLDFLDVTIFCSGVQVKAHKVILSACSNIFKGILWWHMRSMLVAGSDMGSDHK